MKRRPPGKDVALRCTQDALDAWLARCGLRLSMFDVSGVWQDLQYE